MSAVKASFASQRGPGGFSVRKRECSWPNLGQASRSREECEAKDAYKTQRPKIMGAEHIYFLLLVFACQTSGQKEPNRYGYAFEREEAFFCQVQHRSLLTRSKVKTHPQKQKGESNRGIFARNKWYMPRSTQPSPPCCCLSPQASRKSKEPWNYDPLDSPSR